MFLKFLRKQDNNENKIIDNTKTRMKLTNHKEASTSLIKKQKNLNPNIRVYQKITKSEDLKKKADIEKKNVLNQLRNKVREEIQGKKLLENNKKKNEKIINSKINNTFKKETTKKIDCHNKM